MRGIITRFKKDKGFGFFKDYSTNKEYFFHQTEVERNGDLTTNIAEGLEVNATQVKSIKGPRCIIQLTSN